MSLVLKPLTTEQESMKCMNAVKISIYSLGMMLVSCSVEPNRVLDYRQAPLANQNAPIGEFVFDCYNENHAWGHRLAGFFIDHYGKVYRYSLNLAKWKPKTVMHEKQFYYDATELQGKFANKTLMTSIDTAIMQEKIALIENAASGTVSYLKERVADAGRNACIAYRFNIGNNRYQAVELGSYGVSQIKTVNNSSAARALLQWLLTIGPSH